MSCQLCGAAFDGCLCDACLEAGAPPPHLPSGVRWLEPGKKSPEERIAAALERIAAALETGNAYAMAFQPQQLKIDSPVIGMAPKKDSNSP